MRSTAKSITASGEPPFPNLTNLIMEEAPRRSSSIFTDTATWHHRPSWRRFHSLHRRHHLDLPAQVAIGLTVNINSIQWRQYLSRRRNAALWPLNVRLLRAMVLHEDSRGLRVLLQGLDDALTDGLGADEAERANRHAPQRSKTTSNREISPAERHSAQQNSGLTERMPQKS